MKNLEKIFIELLEENKSRLLRFSMLYTRHPDDIKDLFQEIVLNIWKSLPGFSGKSEVSTWVYTIALRTAIRFTKQRKRHRHKPLEGLMFSPLASQNIDNALEMSENVKRLRKCISHLNKIDQILIALFLEDLPYKEIAKIMGITENYVAVKLKRIKVQLFNCMKEAQ